MPEYTIAVAVLDEASTVKKSIKSMLDCTDDTEILVVDGGSTDGTVPILEELSSSFDRIRLVSTANQNTGLPEDRNVSVKEARGEHILLQLDADDCYHTIKPYLRLYEDIRKERDKPFFMSATGINIAPRSLLLEYGPYRRGLPRAEDTDLWRRLAANGHLLWIDNKPPMQEIGADRGTKTRIDNRIEELIGHIRAGVPISGILQNVIFGKTPVKDRLLSAVALPIAAIQAIPGPKYELPDNYHHKTPHLPKEEKEPPMVELPAEIVDGD